MKIPEELHYLKLTPVRTFQLLYLFVLLHSAMPVWGETPQPNILWITAEDMSPNLGCYGDSYADTPNIDALATQGIRFTRFFAESPMCAPSRATIITGMHNGPLGASQMRSNHLVPAFVRPFTAWLRETGYYCVNNSKTDYNLSRDAEGEIAFVREGWDESSPKAHWRNRPKDKPFFCVLNYMDTHQSRTSRDEYSQFVSNVQSRLARERHHDSDKAPLPSHYPSSDIARRTIARYYDCISTLDDFVGRTLSDLESDGLAQDTIVFFYSDHGAGLPTGKACASYFGLHCPLLVRIPEKFQQFVPHSVGSVSDRLACFADLAPTVLHLAKLPVPSHMHGRPFLGTQLASPPEYVFGSRDRMDETLETTRWITDGRHLLVRAYRRDMASDQQSLTSRYNASGELCREIHALASQGRLTKDQRSYWSGMRSGVSLFDTQTDPYNLRNVGDVDEYREQVVSLEQALEKFLLRERDLGFWPEPDLTEAEKEANAFELARRNTSRYPLERIVETAKLNDLPSLRSRLSDDHEAVRYWAVLGLAALGEQARPALSDLQPLLASKSASVRIESAHLIAKLEDGPAISQALDVLVQELERDSEYAPLHAARALELLGEKARPKLAPMRKILHDRSAGFFLTPKGPRPASYGMEFSLLTALEKLGDQFDLKQ